MNDLNAIGSLLQTLFGAKANEIAFSSGFRKRISKLGGAELVYALVGGWLVNPGASRSELAQLTQVSKQALDQSLTEKGATFLKELLEWCVTQPVSANPVALDLLARFEAVYIMDSSTVSLPASLREDWPGCGQADSGGQNEAGVKLHVALDLLNGQLLGPSLTPARTQDRSGPHQDAELPAHSLRIADLGYFDLARLAQLETSGVYFLSKIQAGVHLYQPDGQSCTVGQWLSQVGETQTHLDQMVEVGKTHRLKCRLIAWQVPVEVREARQQGFKEQAQKRQRAASAEQVALSYWTVYLTNVEEGKLSGAEAMVLYRLRWQIELLFKLWKSQSEIDQWQSSKEWAIMCEFYAKLIGAVVQHWLVLDSAWQVAERSLIKVSRVIRRRVWSWLRYCKEWQGAGEVARAAIAAELGYLRASLGYGCHLDRAKTQPSSAQLVLNLSHLNPLQLN